MDVLLYRFGDKIHDALFWWDDTDCQNKPVPINLFVKID